MADGVRRGDPVRAWRRVRGHRLVFDGVVVAALPSRVRVQDTAGFVWLLRWDQVGPRSASASEEAER